MCVYLYSCLIFGTKCYLDFTEDFWEIIGLEHIVVAYHLRLAPEHLL